MSAINHFIKKGVRQAEIDEYLGSELQRAGYGGVDIAKTPLGERLTIHAARPGIVIGRRGKNIRMITDELVTRFGLESPQIEVKEVVNPELNPKVMAYSLVSAIERGVHRRRAAYSVLRRVVNAGAKGCEIIIAGKLTSKRSRHEAYRMGLLAKSGEVGTQYVKRANAIAVMKLGTIGVTVSIMRGDVQLPDELAVLAINLDEVEEVVEDKAEAVEPKKAVKKETPKAKTEPKKEAKEPTKEPAAKKTDLDKKVEELSDLIEKTPGEEKKKPAPKKTTTPKKADDKKKSTTTKKAEPKKKATEVKKEEPKTTKKSTTTKKTTTPKKEDDKKKTTTKKTTTAKKTDAKKSTTTKKADDKKKSTTTKKADDKKKSTTTKKADDKKKTTKKTTTKKAAEKKDDDKKKSTTKKASTKAKESAADKKKTASKSKTKKK